MYNTFNVDRHVGLHTLYDLRGISIFSYSTKYLPAYIKEIELKYINNLKTWKIEAQNLLGFTKNYKQCLIHL